MGGARRALRTSAHRSMPRVRGQTSRIGKGLAPAPERTKGVRIATLTGLLEREVGRFYLPASGILSHLFAVMCQDAGSDS